MYTIDGGSVLYVGYTFFLKVAFVYVCLFFDLLVRRVLTRAKFIMHPNHDLYHGSNMSNLSGYRDLSPNLVLGSYYPEIDDSGGHSSESSERSRLAWEVKVCFSFIYKHYIKQYALSTSQQSQFSSSRSRSRLSTTTESSQENYSALLQANQKLEREKLVLEAKLGALE